MGKSTVSKRLAEELNGKLIDLKELSRKRKIIVGYDKDNRSMLVDEKKINKIVLEKIKKERTYILDSHLAQFVKPKNTDLLVVLRADPDIIEKRLKKRGYPSRKVYDNSICEYLDYCLIESLDLSHGKHLHEINTTKRSVKSIVNEIKSVLSKEKKRSYGNVSWLKEDDSGNN